MKTGCTNETYVNLAKAVVLTVSITAATLLLTHPKFELELERAAAQSKPQRPNVVVITTDDLSRVELNAARQKGWMPNLQTHIANRGTQFIRSYVSFHGVVPPEQPS